MWKKSGSLRQISQYFHYRSFLAAMQPDATHIHKHSHTLAQDRRYRARFSYKFPMGEHQTPPVVWRSSPLFPHPPLLSLSPSLALCSSTFIHSFFPSFLLLASVTQTVFSLSFFLFFYTFLIIDIFQEMCPLCETNCLCVV